MDLRYIIYHKSFGLSFGLTQLTAKKKEFLPFPPDFSGGGPQYINYLYLLLQIRLPNQAQIVNLTGKSSLTFPVFSSGSGNIDS